jgi:hypothetical protein
MQPGGNLSEFFCESALPPAIRNRMGVVLAKGVSDVERGEHEYRNDFPRIL